jgi:hypothetical protein
MNRLRQFEFRCLVGRELNENELYRQGTEQTLEKWETMRRFFFILVPKDVCLIADTSGINDIR